MRTTRKPPKPQVIQTDELVDKFGNDCGQDMFCAVIHEVLTGCPPTTDTLLTARRWWYARGSWARTQGAERKDCPMKNLDHLSEFGLACRDAWLTGWLGEPLKEGKDSTGSPPEAATGG